MKIGILTFHASHNCGSMLQAFALQYVLQRELKADVEIIDYSNSVSRAMYGMWDPRPSLYSLQTNLKRLKHLSSYIKYRKEYIDFSNRYLIKSDKSLKNIPQLKEYSKKYDIIVAGGDQVWNVRCPDGGKEFYLNFTHDVRKIAFSPSLGGTNILKAADDIDCYRKLVKEFEMLSVREPNGKKWLEELSGRSVPIIADPTLLLSKDEWAEALPIPEIKGEYIFCYAFYHNDDVINKALQEISQKTKLPVVIMDTKSYVFYQLDKYGFVKHSCTGPLAFLGLMKNATLVLTQSFHGTLFASLFNRKFWSYNIPAYFRSDDDRAIAILEQMGLPSRYILIDDLLKTDILKEIDFAPVNKNIDLLREQALKYIHSIQL